MNLIEQENLIQKYNVPAPRYTSYPTMPYWDKAVPDAKQWMEVVKYTFSESNAAKGISLYIHLPFCEVLCTYCGCNTRITKNHSVEEGYIQAILAEWKLYLEELSEKPIIRELHLGGGTPTFFKPENLRKLLEGIYEGAILHPEKEFSFEGHPNNTTTAHLQTLFDLGFRRVSYGIQDFDPKVQITINRIQPFENVKHVTEEARRIGYESVNFDLIYGLPYQTTQSVSETIDKVAELMPDRIAFYSYAHVPWVKPGQRSYSDKDLPDNAEKRALYELGLRKFKQLGYTDIGMDHFALPQDTLYKAWEQKELHRNFMGYTTCQTDLLIGLGTSSISDAKYGYMQNLKKVETYKEAVLGGELAILKGHFLTEDDLDLKEAILSIACKGELELEDSLLALLPDDAFAQLNEMQEEGLVELKNSRLTVTPLGKAFTRNICMVFDLKLRQTEPAGQQVFSKAI
ncbi:oxygen-independent coproporphyrinogen III oxidase [Pontibacter cellulosilyticus]|uniref:Coproporphyrinogen-III oxidase n=1 Tax=Pontibacter cellulosilyticus TaxID=1720253 RepID=A0A923SML2_9BACT|nr:oxygen-independent coproporphyrinogen III oxidase [Pontibacter cellulosilyticus]MBC5992305.1 oxygen-independent coproporphyrinogen III oxidase [Pontibacter cellulosilyticus]